jgi:enterochelin esterase family protein
VLAGDRLVVFGAEGVVAVVRATPDGYEEVSRVQALEHSSLTWPALAAGRVLVRNSEELACLEFVERGVPSEALVAGAGEHAFGAFLRGLADADDRVQRIDAFLAAQASFPIVEDGWVHFVFRGDVEDVAVIGSMTSDSRAEPLLRVAGTHLHHRSYPIEPGARWTYAFEVDFNEPIVDPLNPRTSPGPWAPLSDVVAPGHRAVTHLAEPEGPRGRLESHEYASEQLGNSRRIQVYLPPGYDDSDARYPLLLVHDGPDWLEHGLLLNALDNLVGTRVRPLVVVFVSPLRQWWFESGGSRTEPYLAMLATELVPYLEARYRLTQDPAERGLWGVRGFGLTAVFGAVAHPDVFGLAAAQSASLGDVARHAFFAQLAASPPGAARFYVDWGRYEAHDPDSGYDFAVDGRRLFDALSRAGCTVTGGEALDCHGWGSWRSRTDVLLEALFPLR